MKYIQVVSTPAPERAPEFLHLIARSSFVTETRLYDWNIPAGGGPTVLFEVDGDIDRFREGLEDVPGVRTADTTPVTADRFTLLVTLEPAVVPLMEEVLGAVTRDGLVVVKPIVYRDGQVHARIVGSSSVLQTAIGEFPDAVDVEIATVGEFNRGRETPISLLSDRQREALVTAFDLGYYEHPRRATHEDVAARLGCAPNTVSEHLQKAEMKLVRAAMTQRT
jgi:hypothetical protein